MTHAKLYRFFVLVIAFAKVEIYKQTCHITHMIATKQNKRLQTDVTSQSVCSAIA